MIGDARTPMFARTVVGINGTTWQPSFTLVVANVSGFVVSVPAVNGPVHKDYGTPVFSNPHNGPLFNLAHQSAFVGVI